MFCGDGKEDIFKFMGAVYKAETLEQHEFQCPLCKGKAHWGISELNGHLFAGCESCKMRVLE